MKNIIITDVKYRSSLAAVRALADAEYSITVCQTDDFKKTPPAFKSKYVKKAAFLHENSYSDELLELIRGYERPIVIPIGAKTTELLSREREKFKPYCDFLVPTPQALDAANDKKAVAQAALRLGIPTPAKYDGEPDKYPVIVKPSCGEKFGLHAEQRYIRANNRAEYLAALEKMRHYDPSPVVQEYIEGDGVGVCILMTKNHEIGGVICHRRIRELPVTGGPSTCCETIYDKKLIEYSHLLLRELNFSGIAMVEFKGGKLLEINPRVWGSFPLTLSAKSNFTENWVKCAADIPLDEPKYTKGVRMNFIVNDTISAFKYLLCGRPGKFLCAVADFFNPRVKEAVFSFDDPKPFFIYVKNLFIKEQ